MLVVCILSTYVSLGKVKHSHSLAAVRISVTTKMVEMGIKMGHHWGQELALELRLLVGLSEDPGSIHSTHMEAPHFLKHTDMVHRHVCRQSTHMNKRNHIIPNSPI